MHNSFKFESEQEALDTLNTIIQQKHPTYTVEPAYDKRLQIHDRTTNIRKPIGITMRKKENMIIVYVNLYEQAIAIELNKVALAYRPHKTTCGEKNPQPKKTKELEDIKQRLAEIQANLTINIQKNKDDPAKKQYLRDFQVITFYLETGQITETPSYLKLIVKDKANDNSNQQPPIPIPP